MILITARMLTNYKEFVRDKEFLIGGGSQKISFAIAELYEVRGPTVSFIPHIVSNKDANMGYNFRTGINLTIELDGTVKKFKKAEEVSDNLTFKIPEMYYFLFSVWIPSNRENSYHTHISNIRS